MPVLDQGAVLPGESAEVRQPDLQVRFFGLLPNDVFFSLFAVVVSFRCGSLVDPLCSCNLDDDFMLACPLLVFSGQNCGVMQARPAAFLGRTIVDVSVTAVYCVSVSVV